MIAPQSPLVGRVKSALVPYTARSDRTNAAQAAIEASQAEEMLDTLREYIAAADRCAEVGGDDVAAMLHFGEADKAARALVAEMESVC